ncbi:hypothetical protein [Streptomyces bauhiniae]|uniref:hypothetical protein n=1 Tax=Streptomyces bauhiniae TaxID=2340725 RepID=UPI00365A09A2
MEQLFSACTRTGTQEEESALPGTEPITSSLSAAPTIQVLLSPKWQESLTANPRLREALREALGGIVSGSQSHNEVLSDWARVLGGSATLRLVSGGQLIEVEPSPFALTGPPADLSHADETVDTQDEPVSVHARLANELRVMTGLGAGRLATALGVTREQYSRWANGAPISDTKHGQLRYLHTVFADLVRRLGPAEARVWLQTPIEGNHTPVELLTSRQWNELHRRVVQVHDPTPVVDGVMVSLLAPIVDDEDNPEDLGELDEAEAWSPYPLDDNPQD